MSSRKQDRNRLSPARINLRLIRFHLDNLYAPSRRPFGLFFHYLTIFHYRHFTHAFVRYNLRVIHKHFIVLVITSVHSLSLSLSFFISCSHSLFSPSLSFSHSLPLSPSSSFYQYRSLYLFLTLILVLFLSFSLCFSHYQSLSLSLSHPQTQSHSLGMVSLMIDWLNDLLNSYCLCLCQEVLMVLPGVLALQFLPVKRKCRLEFKKWLC